MEAKAIARRGGAWICALGLVICLLGCQPRVYQAPPLPPPLPPAAPPPQVARPTLYVTVNRLNLRACPGMDCPKIAVLDLNAEVEKVGETEDWTQIRVKRDGTLGWVSSRYLSLTPAGPAPEVAPGPTLPPPPGVVVPPPLPEEIKPPPLPEKPPAGEKAKPPKPGEVAPPAKKKPEEGKPPKAAKPPAEEGVETPPKKPAPPAEKPKPAEEKPAPPPEPEGKKGIRIM